MSALPRKTGSNTVGPRVTGAALTKQAGPLPSSQYLDALNVLCEATMSEAITLALSEKDYQDQSGEKTDLQKLLDIEKKCSVAAKVIQKEALPAPAIAMMPPSMPTITAARVNPAATKKAAVVVSKTLGAAPKGMVGKNITPSTSGKAGIVPIRRGSLAGARPVSLQQKRAMVQQLQRSESDETLGSANSAHKKPRIGGGASSSIGSNSDAPPPSALNFLKKLNQDKAAAAAADTPKQSSVKTETKARKKETEKEKPQIEEDDESDASEGNDTKQSSPSSKPPPREGVRKNPARGAKR